LCDGVHMRHVFVKNNPCPGIKRFQYCYLHMFGQNWTITCNWDTYCKWHMTVTEFSAKCRKWLVLCI
jgi:hypothetical protein